MTKNPMHRATVALLLLGLMLLPAASSAGRLRVVAATTDLGAIAAAVGGEEVEVDVVGRWDRDPHSMEIRPSNMRKAARGDIYLKVGMSLDIWSDGVISGSRNPSLTVLDCSQAIEPLEIPTGRVDASMGDVHPEGNPHYWLDPVRAADVADFLAAAFAARDPERRTAYEAGAARFRDEIETRLPGWRQRLQGRRFVEYHRTWIYLAQRFDAEISGTIEPLPGIPPSARHLATLADVIRVREVPVAIRDPYHSASAVEFLERETGIRGAVLPASCEKATAAAFFAHFERIVDTLGRPPSTTGAPATGERTVGDGTDNATPAPGREVIESTG